MSIGADIANGEVTIDGIVYAVPSETDQAYLVMMGKIVDKLHQVGKRNG